MTLPPPECKVYTPPQLADAMVGAIEPRGSDTWLDPCIGPGAFITPLRKRGISKNRIVGIDIDPEAGREDGAATTLRGIDFFEVRHSLALLLGASAALTAFCALAQIFREETQHEAGLRAQQH
jgi:hypothetical protein